MQVVLGVEGNQPFKIKGEAVSRHHAQITINEHDEWYLEDLDSSNGTYIRQDSDGSFVRIGKTRITPMTFVSLGPDNDKGCTFYARQVVRGNYGNFKEEYEYMNDKEDEYDEKEKILDGNIKKIRIAGPIIMILAVFLITGIPFINSILGDYAIQIRIALSSMSGILIALYDGSARKKALKDEREKFHHCPNPGCSHKLKTSEIRNMRCSKCKK